MIAITGPARGGRAPRLLVQFAVWLAGGQGVQLSPARTGLPDPVSGVIVTGGHDVDPVLYAQEAEVQPNYDGERDEFESEIIDHALAADLPLLGICRGAQLLNVRCGGTLHQELRAFRIRTSNRWTVLPLKTLVVQPNTRLHDIVGTPRTRINSLHNQGISELGDDLRVSGRDLDDIVQAVEDPRRDFLIGVQWHPEFLLFHAPQRELFRALVKAARRHTG